MVLAPVVRGRKGEYKDLLEELRAEGFTRAKIDGELRLLEEEIELDKKFKHDIAVVVDRLADEAGRAQAPGGLGRDRGRAGGGHRGESRKCRPPASRRTGPRRPAKPHSTGAQAARASGRTRWSSRRSSPASNCGTSMPELEPRIFSFNSPHGACPRCTGLGSQQEIDPDLVVDPTLTINEGAILPWSSGADYYEQLAQAIADKYEIDLDTPWEDLPEEDQDLFLYGDEGERVYVSYRNRMGRRRSYMAPLEGVVPNLERRYRETDSEYSRERIEEYMSVRPCPECNGARLRPESLAVQGRRASASTSSRASRRARRSRSSTSSS